MDKWNPQVPRATSHVLLLLLLLPLLLPAVLVIVILIAATPQKTIKQRHNLPPPFSYLATHVHAIKYEAK